MLTIHKYSFVINDFVHIIMPHGAKILKFDNQNEVPTIWALVNTELPTETYHFVILGTGQEILFQV